MLIEPKTLENWRDTMLAKFKELLPNANILPDSMIYIDASSMAEVIFMLQQDSITLANNAFIAYATWDELTNLWIDRGIERLDASFAQWEVRIGRDSLAVWENFTVPAWTLLSTTSAWDTELSIVFKTIEDKTMYGQLPTPGSLSTSVLVSWGSLSSWYYNFKVTAVSWDGTQTDASIAAQVHITSWTSNAISVSWAAVPAAESYKIYYASWSTPWTYALLGTSSWPLYVMTNTTTTAGTPPTVNWTGQTEVSVWVIATQAWLYWNVWPWAIDEFISKPLWFDWVINDLWTSGGAEEEDDDTFRERLRDTLKTNSSKVTATWYRLAIEAVPWIRSASVDIPTGWAYRNEILITAVADNASWIPSPALLTQLNEMINSDDYRAVCDNITVVWPTITPVNYAVVISEYDSWTYSTAQITQQVHDAVTAYLASIAPWGKVYKKWIENAINDLDSVIDFNLSSPSANITLAAWHIAAIGTESITF